MRFADNFADNSADNIVIVGAGAAGLACAISAAQQGATVTLVEKSSAIGGTVAHSLIHTIGGLYDDVGEYINDGLPISLAETLHRADPHTCKRQMGKVWTLSVDPAVYQAAVTDWIGRYANITVLCNAVLTEVQIKRCNKQDKCRVVQVGIGHVGGADQLAVGALVDTTGSADVVRMVDDEKVVDGEALAGLIFQIRDVCADALTFPKNVGLQRSIQKMADAGMLPPVFAKTWFDVGVYPDEVYAKLSLSAASYEDDAIPSWQAALLHVLRQRSDFAMARITRAGRLGIRDGGRIKGEYVLTVDDVKNGRTFLDSVGRCAWPIEYWDPAKGVMLDYLSPGQSYEIPLRSLKVAGFENLWVAGKALSAEKLAQASARVAGTCWAMGGALGKALCEE